MKIRILTVGKIDNPHAEALADLYRTRIQHYLPIAIETVKAEKLKSLSEMEVLSREAHSILAKWVEADYNVVLDKEGKQVTSEQFAQFFNDLARQSQKQITFLIGGPLGLAGEIKKKADTLLAFSKMTFPHELATVMLLEQIYRAQSILKGEKYHK